MRQRFSTTLRGSDEKGTTTFVLIPAKAMSTFAPRRRFPVRATVAEARTVAVPPDLAKALRKRLRAVYDAMSFSHRTEYVQWVDDAKIPETRKRRIEKVVDAVQKRALSTK